jgi:hypothetical protein
MILPFATTFLLAPVPIISVDTGVYLHCARGRKVAGSIPDGLTGIFH